jgi:hypothetical protein
MVQGESIEEAPFNFSLIYYIGLQKLREYKSMFFLDGDMIGYRDCLEEIYLTISFNLTKDERKKIEDMIADANKELTNQVPNIKPFLRDVDMELMRVMHRHKMIFPKMETKGLEALKKRFGI